MFYMNAEFLKNFLNYNPETGVFTRRHAWGAKLAGSIIGGLSPQGYWQIQINRRTYGAHRLAWLYVYGEWPKYQIDHINRNRSDNRISNLRDISRNENLHNTAAKCNSTTKVKGVYLNHNKRSKKVWTANIMFKGIRTHLGNFYTKEEAIAARRTAEQNLV
jgi:hypothetical protein